jgi:hypothetical protein
MDVAMNFRVASVRLEKNMRLLNGDGTSKIRDIMVNHGREPQTLAMSVGASQGVYPTV